MSTDQETATHLGAEMEIVSGQVPHAGEVCPYSSGEFPDVADYFKELRHKSPVHRLEDGSFVLSKYDDVFAALRDPETFSSEHELADSDIDVANNRSVVYSDDPVHLGYRQLINRAWTPRAVLELEDSVRLRVDQIFEGILPGEAFDVLDVGLRLARHVFGDALGLPSEQHDRVATWAATGSMFVRPKTMRVGATKPPIEEQRRMFDPGYEDMRSYIEELVERHRDHDQATMKDVYGLPPFARAIVLAIVQDPEHFDEIMHRILPPLQAGGTSTIAHIFPNVIDVILEQPQIWDELRADPSQLDPSGPSEIIEEVLRLRGVVQGLPRIATRDVEVRGTLIPAGSLVHLYYISGSLDEDQFPDPEHFHRREISRHLAFGFGTHSCMGQSLVRLQLKVFLAKMLKRFDHIEAVPDELTWGGLGVYYTPDKMPIVGRLANTAS